MALDQEELAAVQRWTLIGPQLVAIPAGAGAAFLFIWSATDVDLAAPATGWLLLETATCAVVATLFAVGIERLQRRLV